MPSAKRYTEGANALMASRTVLYNLHPYVSKSGIREGLISYLVRLAQAHCVRPRDLVRLVLANDRPDIARLCYNSFYAEYANTINGLGKYARLFADRLNELTGRRDLEELTMLPWAELIPDQSEGLIARHRRWCPQCFGDQATEHREIFAPLAWSMEHYRHCVVHSTPMQQHCPHCGKTQDIIPSQPSLSHCCKCGESLAVVKDTERSEIVVEALITDLLRNPAIAKHSNLRASFESELRRLIEEHHAGNKAAMCRALSWNAWALNGWLEKKQMISFPKLLELMSNYRLFLPGVIYDQAPTPGKLVPAKMMRNRSKRPHLKNSTRSPIRTTFLQELRSQNPRSVTEFARSVDLTRSSLRYWFPDECDALIARRKEIQGIASLQAKQTRSSVILHVFAELRRQGIPITRRAVDSMIKPAGLALARPEIRHEFARLKESL